MSSTFSQLRVCNFGKTKLNATGSSGVGYQLIDYSGVVSIARTTDGVYQTAPGIYAAYIQFPTEFRGQILWDTGSAFSSTYYAVEQHNTEENLPDLIYDKLVEVSDQVSAVETLVSGSAPAELTSAVSQINNISAYLTGSVNSKLDAVLDRVDDVFQMTAGRWRIVSNQMIFYKDDNSTEIMRFNLFDDAGNPTMDAVFDRFRVI